MTHPAIEAVARAICMAEGRCKYSGGKCNTGRCEVLPAVSRAAILAFLEVAREPSEGMLDAGKDFDGPFDGETADAVTHYQAMIDQLRKEIGG